MKQIFKKTILIAMASTICMYAPASLGADYKRPSKESLVFGAEKKPQIRSFTAFEAIKNSTIDVAEQLIPTVVSITSTKFDTIPQYDPFSQFFHGAPFDEFFGTPKGKSRSPEPKQEQRSSVGGSGVIVSKDGYILTNYHVIGKADEIWVQTSDDREFEAIIVGVDSLSDVAVIKIKDQVSNLSVAYFGNSDKIKTGEWVIAVGNPFNFTSTVTHGIVSAIGRHGQGMNLYQNFIQTDAPINPGNSGGALVNMEGELIGINTMIYTNSGGYMGIGFAIPINMAKIIMEQLIYFGKVDRGWLGIQISEIDQNMKDALGLSTKTGVLINEVFEGQPAKKAGLKVGDVIIAIDGAPTKDGNALRNMVANIAPGKKISLDIIRNGQQSTVAVSLSSRNELEIAKLGTKDSHDSTKNIKNTQKDEEIDLTKKVGFSVSAINQEIIDNLDLKRDTKGVIVVSVLSTSFAARKGLLQHDIIKKVKIQNMDFVDATDVKVFKKLFKDIKKDDSILLYVERGGNNFFIAFKVN